MSNKQLSIILKLRDEATKRLEGVRGSLQRFANSWKKNWLAITAAVTASIMALRKAWDLMELGAKAEQQKQAFKNLAASLGMSADKIIEDLRRMSGETLSTSQIMEKASQAMILGIDPTKLSKMMEISRASARAFGKDVGFMFESIAIGVGRQSKLILDNLGIIVSAGDAYEKYAKTLGKSTKELTEMERKQAFLNATLEAGERILQQIDTSTMTNLEKMQKLKAGWLDMAEKIGQALWHVLGFIQGFMNQIISGFFTLLEVANTVFQKLLVPLIKFYEVLGKLPGHMGETYRQAAESVKKLSTSIDQNKKVFELAARESAKVAMEQYDLVFAKVKDTGDKTAEVLKQVAKQVGESAKDTAKQFNAMEEFAKQSARNMQNAFSQFFFKAFTGELRSVKEVFADFGRAVLQMISNILAKLLLIKIFTAMAGPGGNIFGVPVGSLFHEGGIIRSRHKRFIKAHQGLAPDDVPIVAQTGEGILSRRGMSALEGSENLKALNRGEDTKGSGVTINVNQVIQAWDAQDVWRNRKMLSEAIADDIYNNGKIRSVIRSYT
jgi:nitrogen fixation protein FixH